MRERVAKALYEHWVAEDFANEYAPWEHLADKATWLERADAVVALPEIADALANHTCACGQPATCHECMSCSAFNNAAA
jgi:hypothetical protein